MKATIANQMATAPRVYPRSSNSANVYYKKRKPRKFKKKAQVAKSFQVAFHKMQPSKEKRFPIVDTTMVTNGTIGQRSESLYLDNIAQGSQMNQRLGSNIHVSYVHLRGTIQNDSTVKAKKMRFLILREVNLGGLNLSTLAGLIRYEGTSSGPPVGKQSDVAWPVNREVAYTLFDKVVNIPIEADGIAYFNYKLRINRLVRYTSTDSTDVTPYHGHLIFVAFLVDCDNSASSGNVVFNCAARVFFKDYHKAR